MGNIHVFHGVDSKSGTTMISQSVAEFLAKNLRSAKVILLSLHGRPGTEYVDRVGETLEGLKLHLGNEMLNVEKLMENCRRKENLYQIGGVFSLDQVRAFTPDMCVYLLESIAPFFDLVIVDGGNDLDNPLTLGAFSTTKNIYCVISQQESMLNRYDLMQPYYKKIGIEFSAYILNKFLSSDPRTVAYVEKRLATKSAVIKVDWSDYERMAETEKKTFLNWGDNKFAKSIHKVANKVLLDSHMAPIEERKKPWKPFI